MPGSTTSNKFFYVYVLEGLQDQKRYIGYTVDLRRRVEEHNTGKSFSTSPRRPFQLVYYEACPVVQLLAELIATGTHTRFVWDGNRSSGVLYYRACRSEVDAKRRERYLKTTGGRRFLAKRLRHHLFG